MAAAERGISELWALLRTGDWRLHSAGAENGDLTATLIRSQKRRRLSESALLITEQALLGKPSKVIAVERGVKDATVSCAVRLLFRHMGLRCTLRTVPLVVAYAVYAHHTGLVVPCMTRTDDESIWFAVSRPTLPAVLTSTEADVLNAHLDGRSHGAIARARGRAPSTIRNQVHTAREKLNVTTRAQTLELLFESVRHRV